MSTPQDKIDQLNKSIAALQQSIVTQQNSIKSKQDLIDQSYRSIAKAQTDISTMQSTIADLNMQITINNEMVTDYTPPPKKRNKD